MADVEQLDETPIEQEQQPMQKPKKAKVTSPTRCHRNNVTGEETKKRTRFRNKTTAR